MATRPRSICDTGANTIGTDATYQSGCSSDGACWSIRILPDWWRLPKQSRLHRGIRKRSSRSQGSIVLECMKAQPRWLARWIQDRSALVRPRNSGARFVERCRRKTNSCVRPVSFSSNTSDMYFSLCGRSKTNRIVWLPGPAARHPLASPGIKAASIGKSVPSDVTSITAPRFTSIVVVTLLH